MLLKQLGSGLATGVHAGEAFLAQPDASRAPVAWLAMSELVGFPKKPLLLNELVATWFPREKKRHTPAIALFTPPSQPAMPCSGSGKSWVTTPQEPLLTMWLLTILMCWVPANSTPAPTAETAVSPTPGVLGLLLSWM